MESESDTGKQLILTTGDETKHGKKCSVPPCLSNKKVHSEVRTTRGSKLRDIYSLLPSGSHGNTDTYKLNLKQA